MTDELYMPPAERAAYANGHDAHQREILALLGKPFSAMPVEEYLSFLRDVLIRLDVSSSCITKLDDVADYIKALNQDIEDLKDDQGNYEIHTLGHDVEIETLKDEIKVMRLTIVGLNRELAEYEEPL